MSDPAEGRNDPRMRRKLAISAVLLLLLGYASSWIFLKACEIQTASRVVRAMGPSGRLFFVQPEDDPVERRALWDEVGATYRIYDPVLHGPSLIPWGRCGKASPWIPFLASVDYSWVRAPLVGGGGTLWYFCFFGVAVELGHSTIRAS